MDLANYKMEWPRERLTVRCFAHDIMNYRYHWHPDEYELNILLHGSQEYCRGTQNVVLEEDDVLLTPPGVGHASFGQQANTTAIVLHFSATAIRPLLKKGGVYHFPSCLSNAGTHTEERYRHIRFYASQIFMLMQQNSPYAIELTGTERGKIKGNLYELDYAKHYERVKEKELPADTVKLIYEHGEREIPAGQFFNGNPDYELGKFERFEAVPNDPDALQSLLQEERRSREQLPPGDFKAHIAALRDGLIETEARRIVREMKRHDTPNSPNKTHFMVELSPAFMQLAATKDTDRLFSMLPYKTLAFSKIEGRHGTYALIDKGENRDRKIRKPRPSIRAQLKADKAKTAPKKAAAKTKNHDMEV
jgi:hypothetical protein